MFVARCLLVTFLDSGGESIKWLPLSTVFSAFYTCREPRAGEQWSMTASGVMQGLPHKVSNPIFIAGKTAFDDARSRRPCRGWHQSRISTLALIGTFGLAKKLVLTICIISQRLVISRAALGGRHWGPDQRPAAGASIRRGDSTK